MGDPEGDRGPDTPPEKSQKFRVFLAIWVQIPKMTKLPSKHSMSSHHRHASETPFKWRFTGEPMMARLYSHIWILPSKKKNVAKLDPLWQNFLDQCMGYI